MAKIASDKRMLITVWAAVLALLLVVFGLAFSAYADDETASSSASQTTQASSESASSNQDASVGPVASESSSASSAKKQNAESTNSSAGSSSSSKAELPPEPENPEPTEVDKILQHTVVSGHTWMRETDDVTPDTGGSTFTFATPLKLIEIPSDLYWLGNKLQLISSRVGNDVLGAGFEVDLKSSDVFGDARVLGQTVVVSNTVIKGNADIFGFDISVDSDSAANAYYVGAGTARFEGYAHGLYLYGQSIYFNGVVDGDVTLSAQDIVIGPNAKITGLLDIRSGQNLETLDIPASAQIARIDTNLADPNTIDQITQIRATIAPYFQVGSVLFVVVSFILLGLSALWGFGQKLTEANRLVRRYPLAVLVLGCIAIMLMFVIVMLGTVLIFTIPLAAIIALIFLIAAIFCVPFTGASLALLFRRRIKPAVCVILGTGIGAGLLFIPYVNTVVFLGSLVYFIGYMVNISMFGHDPEHDASFHARQADEDAPRGKAHGILPVAITITEAAAELGEDGAASGSEQAVADAAEPAKDEQAVADAPAEPKDTADA